MERNFILTCMLFGSFLFIKIGCNTTSKFQENLSSYSDDTFCKLSATKRMLKGLGITSSKRCLLNNKRDIANLVTSYLNVGLSPSSLKRTVKNYERNNVQVRERTLGEELDYMMDDLLANRNKKNVYCCAPDCLPFMKTLGMPDPSLIKCEN